MVAERAGPWLSGDKMAKSPGVRLPLGMVESAMIIEGMMVKRTS